MDQPLPVPPPSVRRIVYLGSPPLAVPPLRAIVDAGFEVPLVISRPDRRRGRGAAMVPSAVKAAAVELGIATSDEVNAAADVGADLAVVVAYGRLIKPDLLARLPFVNLHFSLLPRWRGAAPVERALLAGDAETGVCVMAMEEGLDTGGVYRRAATFIEETDTLASLRDRLVQLGVELLLDCLQHGFGPAEPQHGEVVYAAKIDPAELHLDFARPTVELLRTISLGRTWTTLRSKRLLVHRAVAAEPALVRAAGSPGPGELAVVGEAVVVGTADGALQLLEVQPEGRARQDATAWRNGSRPQPGELLGR
ncbi:MAG: methionyl-tRNA formyltransferase [Acidimicrobiales bacterium]